MQYTIGYLFERVFAIFSSWLFFFRGCIEIFDLQANFELKKAVKVLFEFLT